MARIRGILAVVVLILNSWGLGIAEIRIPETGEQFPRIELGVPENDEHKTYLGIQNDKSFDISQIDADVVIVEIFSMYCPHCQREAPTLNKLYQSIESDPALKGRLKMIGIGAGNSQFEVDHFRKTYNIPFPLFPDGDFTVHQKIGEVRTPYFFGLKKNGNGGQEIFFSRLGGAKDAGVLLEELVKESGLK